tara:strand:- start:105 stop:281 length:177 start_codon:yes stop_codon:yes gene_type:complete
MGKIKQALICWNEDNGYPADQTYGWDYRNKKALPTIKKIARSYKANKQIINNIIKEKK